nr:DUF1496 domain-containing protein [Vibrio renipiscarius]
MTDSSMTDSLMAHIPKQHNFRARLPLCFFFVLYTFSIAQASASSEIKRYSTPSKAAVIVDGSALNQRVCYYQDHAYSLGAVIEVGNTIIRCGEANEFETNGHLKWVTLPATPHQRKDKHQDPS